MDKSSITIIFPHQLFADHPALSFDREVWLVEDWLFFRQYSFHFQKLTLHRASMKYYEQELKTKGYTVVYIPSTDLLTKNALSDLLHQKNIKTLYYADVVDAWLELALLKSGVKLVMYETPMFMTNRDTLYHFFSSDKKILMKHFYEQQRKRLGILVDEQGNPVGGVWSFDTENRKKLPRGYIQKNIQPPVADMYTQEAFLYICQEWSSHQRVGDIAQSLYAHTREGAQKCLREFIEERLVHFGPYEDAMSAQYGTLEHSVLSPYLNIGLLTPRECLDAILEAYTQNAVPIASVEGCVRQLIGWREFIRGLYVVHGTSLRTQNAWKHDAPLPAGWWGGTTGIDPIDTVMQRLMHTGYAHHIERLMLFGNRLFLEQVHPDTVYQWFMCFFVDSYDWVMVPNVYAMSQQSDKGVFFTKPYISGSHYILSMSDYKKGDWATTWDILYWSCIDRNRDFFAKNYRMRMMVSLLDKRKK